MKGKIRKIKGFWGDRAYRIIYDKDIWGSEEANIRHLDIRIEDMAEFIDDIMSGYMDLIAEKKQNSEMERMKKEMLEEIWGEPIKKTAMEAVKARKGWIESEKERAYEEGYKAGFMEGFNVKYGLVRKKSVITKQEEAEQDRDRREMDSETKTYNNFPTDEALNFDVNVRERV